MPVGVLVQKMSLHVTLILIRINDKGGDAVAEPSTFIKIDRNIMDWRWYQDGNTFRVFLHLLLKANIKDKDFEKITIHRGEIATSYPSLAIALGMSVQNIRTAIAHLKETGEVTVKTYAKFSVISIKNYNLYQTANSQLTGNQQATNSQLTGNQQQSKNKRIKESKNGRNSSASDEPPTASSSEIQEVVNCYHEICKSFPKLRAVSEARKKAIHARLKSYGMDAVKEVFKNAESSDFLKGKNNRNWSPNFDWMIKDTNFVKILDGNYNNHKEKLERGAMNGNGSNIWNAGII